MNYARIYDDLMRRSFHRELSGYPSPSAGRYKVSDEELLNALILHDWRYPTAFKSVGLSIGSNYKRARKLEEIHRGMV